ncbi:MAG: aspartate carbamoyltransferase regulatory subunit [Bacteroidales bacterium]|jgi:aspartate carbamoyltransferase regulatory subunit|uniref:Aspartate carbamoyltransferase regulatory chain n=1 Tax=bioreactor metagenome TaxID=1076179 RepID=A0A644UEM9_9ZZZZ|nr:aspartate carbamoyltransferase regulatory subunit [Bacteroidales bacterium]MDD4739137.1 aspartate carbamoyltransferase regulatory subunit [Bacteroidales bacterium]MDY4790457.1 aspartate carbamoyltransferase regulatory subunit [Bacteroidales bacterium]
MTTENKKELIVSAIENGTVIDHIPVDTVLMVLSILGLDKYEDEVLIGNNLNSKKYGKKGIIKARNKFFEQDDINKIALVAPNATLIVIRDYEVVEKKFVEIPEKIEKILKCINPNCITNKETIETKFNVIEENPLKIQCHYCEKTMTNIRFAE